LTAHVDNASELSASQSVQPPFIAARTHEYVAVISVSGIQWKPHLLSLHRETPNLYVEIDVGGKKVYRSSAKRTWAGMWNDISSL
jgi:hypothetical protein